MRTVMISHLVLSAVLGTLVACSGGGGSSSAAATSATALAYTAPSSGTYQLVKSSTYTSSSSHLVLDLVGPSATSLSGVGFYLTVDSTKAKWATVDGSALAVSSAFTSPTVVKSQVSGGTLQVGAYQLGTTAAITTGSSTVLATVALDLLSGVSAGTVTLAVPTGKAAILNAPTASSATTAISISVGTLTAN